MRNTMQIFSFVTDSEVSIAVTKYQASIQNPIILLPSLPFSEYVFFEIQYGPCTHLTLLEFTPICKTSKINNWLYWFPSRSFEALGQLAF